MVFAYSTDDRSLIVFSSEADAIAYCESVDVEAGVWLFFDAAGQPLQVSFSEPKSRGFFVVLSRQYHLVPAVSASEPSLLGRLSDVAVVEGPAPFNSISAIRRHLQRSAQAESNGSLSG
jgi:hypothetical protein